jgi:ketosteroid isomerase-like protein
MSFVHTLLLAASLNAANGPDTTATKNAILAADRALAAQTARNGATAFIDALEPNAAVLFPGQPILKGASAARAPFVARYGAPSSYSWNPVHAVASTDGNFGCTMGYSRFHYALDSVKTEHRGVYITCWTKDSNGKWRIAGTQRADTPQEVPLFVDSATLPGGPHSATISRDRKDLTASQDADSLFAMLGAEAAGPGPAFVKYAANDGMVIGGGEFPRGPENIGAMFKGYPADRVITWRPMRDVGAGSGGLTFTVGHSMSGPRPGKAGPTITNKYLTVWRQEPDGRWLYIFDLGSSRPAS